MFGTTTLVSEQNIAKHLLQPGTGFDREIAIDPGWGHYEILGISGFATRPLYPGVTRLSQTGITDIKASPERLLELLWCQVIDRGYYVNSIVLGGFGRSLRVPISRTS